jgi:hypothetical protein
MRRGNTRLSTRIGSARNVRFGAVGCAELPPGRAATASRDTSVSSCVGAQIFRERRSIKQSTRVYLNPRVNVFAPRHFLASNVPDGR